MAIEGPLRELGIHDVFQLLDLSRKTGRLRVTSALRDNEGTVFFRDGRVVSATVRSNPHPLGAMLLRAGKITEADVARARARQQEPGESRRFGELLVQQGVLSQRELDRYVRQQIEAVVFELMAWQEGFFSFTEVDLDDLAVDATAAVTTEALLMEGARRIDEWTHIQQRIPHLGVIPSLAPVDARHPATLELLPHEWEVLAAIDGETDLRGVAAHIGRSDFQVAKIAFGLVATGIVVVREPVEAPTTGSDGAELATLLNDTREALREGRADDALAFGATAVSLAPHDAEGRLLLARALFQLDREMEGEEELRRSIELDGRNPLALMEAAKLSARRGELGQAISHWQRVVLLAAETPIGDQARDAIAHASRLSAVLEAVDA